MTTPEPLSRDNIGDRIRARVAEQEPVERLSPVLTNALTERGKAISDWFLAATIHAPDGTVLVAGFALLGNRETADDYAAQVDAFLVGQPDEVALTEWMMDLNRGGGAVRSYGLAPLIAADLMVQLRDLGYL